jgi:hypothetical protein
MQCRFRPAVLRGGGDAAVTRRVNGGPDDPMYSVAFSSSRHVVALAVLMFICFLPQNACTGLEKAPEH